MFGKHGASAEDILKWADRAMYRAKDAGLNSIQFSIRKRVIEARLLLCPPAHGGPKMREVRLFYWSGKAVTDGRLMILNCTSR